MRHGSRFSAEVQVNGVFLVLLHSVNRVTLVALFNAFFRQLSSTKYVLIYPWSVLMLLSTVPIGVCMYGVEKLCFMRNLFVSLQNSSDLNAVALSVLTSLGTPSLSIKSSTNLVASTALQDLVSLVHTHFEWLSTLTNIWFFLSFFVNYWAKEINL